MDENKHIYNQLKKLEEVWGIKAWNDLMSYISSIVEKLKDTQKSREKWRERAKLAEGKIKDDSL